jgi:hypothetical protein
MGLRDWLGLGNSISEDQQAIREQSRKRSLKRLRDTAKLSRTEEEQATLDSARDEYEALRRAGK